MAPVTQRMPPTKDAAAVRQVEDEVAVLAYDAAKFRKGELEVGHVLEHARGVDAVEPRVRVRCPLDRRPAAAPLRPAPWLARRCSTRASSPRSNRTPSRISPSARAPGAPIGPLA